MTRCEKSQAEAVRSADWVVLVLYFILLQVVGFATGKKQKNTTDYLLASRSLPWWAVAASIVAAETSALTFISVPGIAYTGNFTFMQLAFGYVVGRILVAFFLLPAYFRGQCETVYAFLEKRFSRRMRLFAALVFQLTRLLATGVRLYATALPLALISGWSVPVAVLVFAALTLPYIFSGGLRSGVWVESVQAVVYLAGALAAVAVLYASGSDPFVRPEKWVFFSGGTTGGWRSFFTEPLHLVAGICGGALLTISSHGTDQLIVQKVLACRNLRDAQKAMIASGILADLQFLLFLFIGVWLFAFFNGQQFASPDAIFPQFIVAHLPAGITGLVLAAIFATGQSTLSATVTALASSTMLDLFPQLARTSERRRIQIAQLFTLFWTVGIVAIAFLFTDSQNPVVVVALKLSSLVAGAVVGLYILGFLAVAEKAAFAGFMVSVVGVGLAAFSTPLAWTWYVPLGTVLALLTALAVTVFHKLISRGR